MPFRNDLTITYKYIVAKPLATDEITVYKRYKYIHFRYRVTYYYYYYYNVRKN